MEEEGLTVAIRIFPFAGIESSGVELVETFLDSENTVDAFFRVGTNVDCNPSNDTSIAWDITTLSYDDD